MVVLYEGLDLCYFRVTRRYVSEICENGEQGGLIVGSGNDRLGFERHSELQSDSYFNGQ